MAMTVRNHNTKFAMKGVSCNIRSVRLFPWWTRAVSALTPKPEADEWEGWH